MTSSTWNKRTWESDSGARCGYYDIWVMTKQAGEGKARGPVDERMEVWIDDYDPMSGEGGEAHMTMSLEMAEDFASALLARVRARKQEREVAKMVVKGLGAASKREGGAE